MNPLKNRPGLAGFLWGAAAVLLWGLIAAISRSLLEMLGMFTAGGCIYMAGALVCFFLYPPKRRRFSWRYHAGCGGLAVAYFIFFSLGLGFAANRTQAVEMGLINYLWPLLTLLFSIPVFRKRFSVPLLLLGVVLSVAGFALSTSQLSGIALTPAALAGNFCSNPLPYLLMTGAAVSWALYSVFLGVVPKETPKDALPYFMLTGGVILFCLRYPFHETSVWSAAVWIQIAVLALLPIGSGYSFWDRAMQFPDPLPAISFSYLTPLFSALCCAFFLELSLPRLFYGACLMVIAGAWLCRKAIRN